MSRQRRVLREVTQEQLANRGNLQPSVLNVKLQLSPQRTKKMGTPGSYPATYDRKALSELLRSSAQTLIHTDSELQRAKEKIILLELELELRLSSTAVVDKITHCTQTETETTAVEGSASTQTKPIDRADKSSGSTETETGDNNNHSVIAPQSSPPSGFVSIEEFDKVVTELIEARLANLELSMSLEAAMARAEPLRRKSNEEGAKRKTQHRSIGL